MKMVALAYGFIWLAVFSYVFIVSRRLGRLNGEMDELRRRIDRLKPS
jgi:CcmD family protein